MQLTEQHKASFRDAYRQVDWSKVEALAKAIDIEIAPFRNATTALLFVRGETRGAAIMLDALETHNLSKIEARYNAMDNRKRWK